MASDPLLRAIGPDPHKLQRCADLVGRASRYGLESPARCPATVDASSTGGAAKVVDRPTSTALAATAPLPTPDRFSAADPAGGRIAATGPSSEGPRFRGATSPSFDCRWSMIGQDVGSVLLDAVLVIGRVPVADPTATLENLVDPHVSAIKKTGFSGRIKRITGPCKVDLLDGQCVDLRLDPPRKTPYRVLAGVVVDRGNTWSPPVARPHPHRASLHPVTVFSWPPVGAEER